ncbi:MAG: trypsin-like serine protease [Alphaproteobacteria bacterium]
MTTAMGEPLRGVKGDDDRIPVDAGEYPWSAIGRLNNSLGAFCTGAMIGRRLMLTAAHCLWNKKTRDWMPDGSLHFVAGYHHGEYLAHATVKRHTIGPGFRGGGTYDARIGVHDWALVELNEDIGTTVGWFGLQSLGAGDTRVLRAGYGQDRPHLPTAHLPCAIVGRSPEGLLLHDCDAVSGDSGSPIFVWHDGGVRIVAIHVSTMGKSKGAALGGAVGTATFIESALRGGASAKGYAGAAERAPVKTNRQLASRRGKAPPPSGVTDADSLATLGRLLQGIQ